PIAWNCDAHVVPEPAERPGQRAYDVGESPDLNQRRRLGGEKEDSHSIRRHFKRIFSIAPSRRTERRYSFPSCWKSLRTPGSVIPLRGWPRPASSTSPTASWASAAGEPGAIRRTSKVERSGPCAASAAPLAS